MVGPGADAALLRLGRARAAARRRAASRSPTDSNPRACALDPRRGTALVLAEGSPTWPASGRTPAAVVNCLNFGNPEHPEVMWQLSECIDGMAEACRALVAPGHRRQRQPLQRERRGRHRSTPVSECSGWSTPCSASARDGVVVTSTRRLARRPRAGDGSFPLDGTRWAAECRGHRAGAVPAVDFDAHGRLRPRGRAGGGAGRRRGPGLVAAVHDVSGGGLAVAAGRDGGRVGHRLRGGARPTRPGCSPSCPPASSSPRATPTRCAPGPRRPGCPQPCSAGPAATASRWGTRGSSR